MTERVRDTRVEEKEDLRDLNDRLEHYVAHTRGLRASVEVKEREITELHKTHTRQIAELEKHYQSTNSSLTAELKQANKKLAQETEAATQLRAELAALRSQLKDISDARNKLQDQLALAQSELSSLQGSNATLRSDVAALTEAREREAKLAKETTTKKLSEARATWDDLHRQKLEALERELREEFNTEMEEYKKRESEAIAQVARLHSDYEKAIEESKNNQSFAASLLKRIAEFEASQSAERAQWESTKGDLEKRLSRALAEKAAKIDEFNRLMDVKISLQAEIEHYRKILEQEEVRTGLSPTPNAKKARRESDDGTSTPNKQSWQFLKAIGLGGEESHTEATSTEEGPKARRASLVARSRVSEQLTSGRKRKHHETETSTHHEETLVTSESHESTEISASASSERRSSTSKKSKRGVQSLSDADMHMALDAGADSVTVENRTASVIVLAGWSLRSQEKKEIFHFPADLRLQPGESVRVWSGPEAEKKATGTNDLFWSRDFVWNNAGDVAVLFDADGHEVSRVIGRPGEKPKQDNCVIM